MGRTDAHMSLTVSQELRDEFVKIANKNHRSITQELIIAMKEHIEQDKLIEKTPDSVLEDKIKTVIADMKQQGII